MSNPYPQQILNQIDIAEQKQRAIARKLENHPPSGRPRTGKRLQKVLPIATGQDPVRILMITDKVLGSRAKGNKRWGKIALYLDLVDYFSELKRQGVCLPRQHLSAVAAQPRLEQILIRHGYLHEFERGALGDATKRDQVGRKMARIFIRVANAIN